MSLDVYLNVLKPTEIYHRKITHNLAKMADAAGIYMAMWRPDEIAIAKAHQLIPLLEKGLADLQSNPEKYRPMNPPNGWGTYLSLVDFVCDYLAACVDNPDADVEVSR